MNTEVEIQTVDEVKKIDYMKTTNEIINNQMNEQINNLESLNDTLDNVNTTLNLMTSVPNESADISEVVDSINNIDTTVIEAQTQDILSIINQQQSQIDDIQLTMNEINKKLNDLINQ